MFDRIAFMFKYIVFGEETVPSQFRRTRIMIIPEDVRMTIARAQKENKGHTIHDAFVSAYSNLFPRKRNRLETTVPVTVSASTASADVYNALLRPYVGVQHAPTPEASTNKSVTQNQHTYHPVSASAQVPVQAIPATQSPVNNAPHIDEVKQYVAWSKANKPSMTYRAIAGINHFPDRIDGMINFVWERKIIFALIVYVIFFGCVTALYAAGALPEAFIPQSAAQRNVAAVTFAGAGNNSNTNGVEQATGTQRLIEVTGTVSATSTTKKPVVAATTTKKPSTTTSNTGTVVATVKKPVAPTIKPSTLGQDPLRVIIDRVGLNTRVTNPISTNIDSLDANLKLGAVRYPGSPGLGAGNTFLLAHSTSFKVVNNQAYKAFNGLKYAERGDIVRVQSIDKEYRYRVTGVRMAANSEIFVPFTVGQGTLTLVTCNVLGAKEDRYIVDAELIEVAPLTSVQ